MQSRFANLKRAQKRKTDIVEETDVKTQYANQSIDKQQQTYEKAFGNSQIAEQIPIKLKIIDKKRRT